MWPLGPGYCLSHVIPLLIVSGYGRLGFIGSSFSFAFNVLTFAFTFGPSGCTLRSILYFMRK